MKAIFDKNFVKKLDGEYVKSETTHRDRIDALRTDIQNFRKERSKIALKTGSRLYSYSDYSILKNDLKFINLQICVDSSKSGKGRQKYNM